MFGDAPRCSPKRTVAAAGVLGRAALAACGGFAGVKRAKRLGLVGLALPVQQLVQDLRQKTQHKLCGEVIYLKTRVPGPRALLLQVIR